MPVVTPRRNPQAKSPQKSHIDRIKFLYAFLIIVGALFTWRLFYLQVIKHSYYRQVALSRQLSERSIPASRGEILAQGPDGPLAIVLNETRYTIAADPSIIKNPEVVASKIAPLLGIDQTALEKKLKLTDTRYQILAKKVTEDAKKKVIALKFPGIVPYAVPQRTYPQGALAAQVLGFVNDEGVGQYGLEGFLNNSLSGIPGQMKAITDASGIPLAASPDNRVKEPVAGKNIVLTLDIGLQQAAQEILQKGLETAKSKSGSLIVIDPTNGAVKALANYPSYDVSNYSTVEDATLFQNASISQPLEVGSVMKPLTAAAALNEGAVNENTSYFDPAYVQVGDAKVTNIEEDGGAGTRNLRDILQLSLNTGAVYLLKSLGGGEINEKARVTWHDYLTNHFGFGSLTGIEQEGESVGIVPDPIKGDGRPIQYANMAFGQGMTVTPLQLAAATTTLVNGGTYYKPHLIEGYIQADGSEKKVDIEVIRASSLKPDVSTLVRGYMEYTVSKNNLLAVRKGFVVGGKTGTAQIPRPEGGYYEDRYNGMYIGYVGVDKPKYVIVVRVDAPAIRGYAGAQAAAPIFATMSNTLIDTFGLSLR